MSEESDHTPFDAWNTPWGNMTWTCDEGDEPFSQEEIDSWNKMTPEELAHLTRQASAMTAAELEAIKMRTKQKTKGGQYEGR
jgi:hypothetical protein